MRLLDDIYESRDVSAEEAVRAEALRGRTHYLVQNDYEQRFQAMLLVVS